MKFITSLFFLALLTPLSGTARSQDKPAAATPTKPDLHTYRLTYTFTEIESGKKVGVQHFSLTAVSSGQLATLKIGSRVPAMTGGRYEYMDVGLNIAANVDEHSNGVQLDTNINQSSLEDSAKAGLPPIVRQAQLQTSALLQVSKPIQIGSLDIPGSTHHLDVEVVLEKIS